MTASGSGGTFTWYSDPSLTAASIIGTGTTLTPGEDLGLTTYYVTETLNGCEGPSSQVLITINFCEITFPTAFTPFPVDGVNDDWEIDGLDLAYPDNQVFIYNRWGNIIFTSDKGNYNQRRWDGTYNGELLPVGSYYFIIEYNNEDPDNNSETGTVSIIINK